IGPHRGDVVGRGPGRRSLARGVADLSAEPPPAAGEGAGAAVGVAAVDAEAEAGVVALVLRIEVVVLFGDERRVGGTIDTGGHAVAFIGAEHAAPRLLRGRGRSGAGDVGHVAGGNSLLWLETRFQERNLGRQAIGEMVRRAGNAD